MRQMVDQFHTYYNNGQYDKIFYELVERPDDPHITFEMAQGCLQYTFDQLGRAGDTKLVDSFQKDFFSDDTILRLTYRTAFARDTADEEFTFHVVKNHATLVKWYCTGKGPK